MRKLFGIALIFASALSANGQPIEGGPIPSVAQAPGVLDGTYVETIVPLKKPIPYDDLREADAVWTKRVWRSIDLRERTNHPLYYPLEEKREMGGYYQTYENSRQWSLWRIIKYHAYDKLMMKQSPDITVFHTSYGNADAFPQDGDGFKYPVVPKTGNYQDKEYMEDVMKLFNDVTYTPEEDSLDDQGYIIYDPNNIDPGTGMPLPAKKKPRVIKVPIMSEDIVRYDLKEEWFFDKERSVLDVRILGIAPVFGIRDPTTKQFTGKTKRLFWIYFPECRQVFARYFVFNTRNDAMRMSYDDIFWKRQFASYVTKENNVYDREINDYKIAVDALLESERIKEEIFNFEHDVWHF
jgi:gliding motility associated protien GldN